MKTLDISLLQALPDNVKRRIVDQLQDSSAAGPAHTTQTCRSNRPAVTASSTASDGVVATNICSRQVQIPSLGASHACVVDGVLSVCEIKAVAAAVKTWLDAHGRQAGMGGSKSGGRWHDAQHRGDITSWVTVAELQAAHEPLLVAVVQLLDSIKTQLDVQGYDVSGRCSIQLACYPGAGARYARHADASDAVPGRTVSALLYLNSDWDAQVDGGQLVLYNAVHTACGSNGSSSADAAGSVGAPFGYLAGEPALVVSPIAGRLLVFDSRLNHEVLPAQKHRYAITAFFYRQSHKLAEPPPAAAAVAAIVTSQVDNSTAAHPLQQLPALAQGTVQQQPANLAAQAMPVPTLAAAADTTPTGGVTEQKLYRCNPSSNCLPRIFVSIAAFRDPECQWTLRDLFVNATHPERVFVGVVWQIDPVADSEFVRIAGGESTAKYQHQVSDVRLHYRTATGPCAARSLSQQLWAGEEYVLQIDSHMRFVQGWDRLCLQQLQAAQQAAGSERVVLSTYPLGYVGDGAAAAVPENGPATVLCAKSFDETGVLRIQARSLLQHPAKPVPSCFWAAGFSFSPAAWLLEVPYCPHLPHLFFGEEMYMLARMVTHGWQVYAPNQPVMFHQWERSARSNSYQTCIQVDMKARAASQAKVLKMLQEQEPSRGISCVMQINDNSAAASATTKTHLYCAPTAADWAPGALWGLGRVKTLQQFQDDCGVNFIARSLTSKAVNGGQPAESFAT